MIEEENIITIDKLNDYIEVRSEPHIYAFSTNTVPNYIKVGDTFRPIEKRLDEWRNIYEQLKRLFPSAQKEYEGLAKLDNEEIYFRDYSLHKYFENNKISRLTKQEFNNLLGSNNYYSNEFFKDLTLEDIKKGIKEIKGGYNTQNPNYQYYKLSNRKYTDVFYKNDKDWKLRENQEEVVNNFLEKCEAEKELLMYAVMRFGKSFTSLSCAKAKEYKKVLVVSAKADVANEWKKTVQMPKCFKEYAFITDRNLRENPSIIENVLTQTGTENDKYLKDKSRVVVFLTLQNLSGKSSDGENIKARLKEAFETEYDLIIIDETHYGAWARAYGKPLNDKIYKEEDSDSINKNLKDLDNFNKKVKTLKGKVKLHLSGTPYNLLYDQKFTEKNIVATCQFSDILNDKKAWDILHRKDIDEGVINPSTGYPYEEFDNPYFGFPRMLRFAFNLPVSTQERLISASKNGNKWSLNDFLITDKNGKNVKFIYEQDVLKLLQIIDGNEHDDSILSFLDIPKIKDNKVCKHIVMVLPYKYSCDAMETLLVNNKDKFKNLMTNCEVLNITGHNIKKEFENIDSIKTKISDCEKAGKKTITLTVNKMLTGVTVPEWDTMIMLKNTKSAQEYDQAIFRIQNQNVEEIETTIDNEKRIAKIDKKPQTILVDFDPIRMFELQGLSTRIVNKVSNSEKNLNDAISVELNYFPIITTNANKLVKVTPTNIVEIIANYNKNLSILEASEKVDFDESMLNNENIKEFLKSQSSKGIGSKMKGNMHDGETKDADVDDSIDNTNNNDDNNSPSNNTQNSINYNELDKDEKKDYLKRYRNSIAKLMFYSFLTKSNINTLQELYNSVFEENEEIENNKRIFDNLKLKEEFVADHIKCCKGDYALEIDNAVAQANLLSRDSSLSEEKRVENALARFNRISESEVVTPQNICKEIYETIGQDKLCEIVTNNGKILDIASKTGEFAVSLYYMLKDKVDNEKLKKSIYSIPTSKMTYEFTRKIYEILGMPLENIATEFNSYSLLDIKLENSNKIDYDKIVKIITQDKNFNKITIDDNIEEGGKKVKFDAVVGNPPYQDQGGSGGNNDAPIYQHFSIIADKLKPNYSSLIIKAGWFSAGRENLLGNFRKFMLNNRHVKNLTTFTDASLVFGDKVEIKGGICYYCIDGNYVGDCKYSLIDENGKIISVYRKLNDFDVLIREPILSDIVKKVQMKNRNGNVDEIVSSDTPFGIPSNPKISKKNPFKVYSTYSQTHNILLYHIENNDRKVEYVNANDIHKNKNDIKKFKAFIPGGYGAGEGFPHQILGYPEVAQPNSVCSQSYLYVAFISKYEADNFVKYLKTKLFRALVLSVKITQSAPKRVYKFVPLQDFTDKSDIDWSKSISEIDQQLYKKYNLTEEEINFIESKIKPME